MVDLCDSGRVQWPVKKYADQESIAANEDVREGRAGGKDDRSLQGFHADVRGQRGHERVERGPELGWSAGEVPVEIHNVVGMKLTLGRERPLTARTHPTHVDVPRDCGPGEGFTSGPRNDVTAHTMARRSRPAGRRRGRRCGGRGATDPRRSRRCHILGVQRSPRIVTTRGSSPSGTRTPPRSGCPGP